MRILHTADWHLGHRLHERSQREEQALFLQWLEDYIKNNEIDILLISGDVFDTGVPSSTSQKLYYDFLISLQKTNCSHVVITGGNHDSPGTINAPKALLDALSVKVVGKAEENVQDEVFRLSVGEESVVIGAVPYLRDQDIRRAVAGEAFEQLEERYRKALKNHYQDVAKYCKEIKEGCPVIAMGHLFALGGEVSESEQNIYVGNLGHIGAGDFPTIFDYIALGHLHRSQKVGKKEHIRYSGSPVILSFSEVSYDKQVLILTTSKDKISDVEEVKIPRFREVVKVKGTLEKCMDSLRTIKSNTYGLTPWVEVVLKEDSKTMDYAQITELVKDLPIDVLKTSRSTIKNRGIEQVVDTRSIKELSPLEVFRMKCEDQAYDLGQNKEVLDAFEEALQIAQEN